jgi:hypothetical protein
MWISQTTQFLGLFAPWFVGELANGALATCVGAFCSAAGPMPGAGLISCLAPLAALGIGTAAWKHLRKK